MLVRAIDQVRRAGRHAAREVGDRAGQALFDPRQAVRRRIAGRNHARALQIRAFEIEAPHPARPGELPLGDRQRPRRAHRHAPLGFVADRAQPLVHVIDRGNERIHPPHLDLERIAHAAVLREPEAEVALQVDERGALLVGRELRALDVVPRFVGLAARARDFAKHRGGRRRHGPAQDVLRLRRSEVRRGGRGSDAQIRGSARQLLGQHARRQRVERQHVGAGSARLPRSPQRIESALGQDALETVSLGPPVTIDLLITAQREGPVAARQGLAGEGHGDLAPLHVAGVVREQRLEDCASTFGIAALEGIEAHHVPGARGIMAPR